MRAIQTNMTRGDNIQNMGPTTHEKLAKLLHTITPQKQYAYKAHLPKMDAITKLESYIERPSPETHIVLVDIT